MAYLNIQKLNTDGSLDNSYNDIDENIISGNFNCAEMKHSGNLLVGGNHAFLTNPTTSINALAKLNADGNLSPNQVYNLPVSQNNNGVYLQNRNNIYLQNTGSRNDGVYFTKFDGNLNNLPFTSLFFNVSAFNKIQFDSSGKIYVGFNSSGTDIYSNICSGLLILNLDGTYNSTPNTPILFNSASLVSNSTNNLIFADKTEFNYSHLIKLNPDLTQDNTFTKRIINYNFVEIQDDGKLLITGSTNNGVTIDFDSIVGIVRLNADFSFDTAFNTNANIALGAVRNGVTKTLPDGQILVTAVDISSGNQKIFRLNSDGTLDTSFNINVISGISLTQTIAYPLNNGQIILFANAFDNQSYPNIIRLNSDGTLDTTFNVDQSSFGNSSPRLLIEQNDGKILINGGLFNITNYISLVRLNLDGSIDTTFAHNTFSSYSSLHMIKTSDNKLLLEGNANDGSQEGILRINPDGILDNTFVDYGIGNNSVNMFLTLNRIIVAGDFDRFFRIIQNSPMIVRLNADGTLDNSFNLDPNTNNAGNYIRSFDITSTGEVFLCGGFTNTSVLSPITTPSSVIKLNNNGSINSSIASMTSTNNLPVEDVRIYDGIRIFFYTRDTSIFPLNYKFYRTSYAGVPDNTFNGFLSNPYQGSFDLIFHITQDGKFIINDSTYLHFFRSNQNGDVDTSFNTDFPSNTSISNIDSLSSGKLVLSLPSDTIGNVPSHICMLNVDGTIDTTFTQQKIPNIEGIILF